MVADFRCAECGETEDLSGRRGPDGIRITCGTCGASWLRDTAERCAECGGADLVRRTQVLTQYSRGTQLSVVGTRQIPLCPACDAEMLAYAAEGRPVPNHYRPRALGKPSGPDGDDGGDGGSSTQILPR
ncbi:MAG: hypothetical protein GEU93_03610 [Propionibacteriales bacterium]|nr:hypothetical protein [Propionibacteriales bacterium]